MFITRYNRFLFAPEGDAPAGGGGGGEPEAGSAAATAQAEQRVGDIRIPAAGGSMKIDTSSRAEAAMPVGGQQEQQQQAQQEQQKPAEQQQEQKPWDFKSLMDAYGAKLDPANTKIGEMFKNVRDFADNVVKDNEKLSMTKLEYESKLATLTKQLEEAGKGTGSQAAQPHEIVAMKAQLEELNSKYTEATSKLGEFEARGKLEGHPVFKQEYEGRQADIMRNAKLTADAVNIPQEKLDEIFSARGELAITKAINALGDIDPDAKTIIKSRAMEWDALEGKKEALLSGKAGKSPSQILAEFEALQADQGVQLAKNFSRELMGKLITATDGAVKALAEKDPIFTTPHGQNLVDALRLELQSGKLPSYEEVVHAQLLAKTGAAWRTSAMEMKARAEAAEAQVKKLTAQLPSPDMGGGTGGSPRPAAGGNTALDPSLRTGDITLFGGRR